MRSLAARAISDLVEEHGNIWFVKRQFAEFLDERGRAQLKSGKDKILHVLCKEAVLEVKDAPAERGSKRAKCKWYRVKDPALLSEHVA